MTEPRASSEDPGAQALRARLVERRRALSEAAVRDGSLRIAARLADDPLVRRAAGAGPVGVYWPVRGEPDIRPAAMLDRPQPKALRSETPHLETPHGVTLPGHPAAGPRMLRWEADTPLATAWGALRHPDDRAAEVPAHDHGLILVPAVAFDLAGNRLGTGGGWYDRLLAGLSGDNSEGDIPLLVGIAHGFQVVAHLDAQPWDVPMDLVITPSESFVALSGRS